MAHGITRLTLWGDSTAVASTATITSKEFPMLKSTGTMALLIELTGSSRTVDVKMVVSDETGGTFRAPVDVDDMDLGTINSGLTSAKWIQFSPALARFFKITVTGTAANGANTAVKAWLILETSGRR